MKRAFAVAVTALLLTSCGSSSLSLKDQLKDDTAALVDAVNGKDVTAVRSAVGAVRTDVSNLLSQNQIRSADAAAIDRYLDQINQHAGDLNGPSPTPTPSETPSSTPSATPSPTPSATPSPTSSPTPSPTPPVVTSPPALPSLTATLGGGSPTATA